MRSNQFERNARAVRRFCGLAAWAELILGQRFVSKFTSMKYTPLILTAMVATLLLLPTACTTTRQSEHAQSDRKIPPIEALARLKSGNERFVANKLQHPHQTAERRSELAGGQHPFAVVLGCADSRTPPEIVFDQGLGDLFVVRVAGNVLNDENVGSIEYGVKNLGAHLIVVLGHEHCGAIKAARETIAAKATAPGHIQSLVEAIRPAVESTIGKDVEATTKANVLDMVQSLRHSGPILQGMVTAGSVVVVGAYYNLDTGAVEFLEDAHAK